jgi:ribosome-binding factor A
MPTLRQEKISSAIKRLAGEFLTTYHNEGVIITPIKADISRNLDRSTIFITVFPEDKEKEILKFLKRKRSDFRNYVKKNIKIKSVPMFDFEIDLGEKNRQKIEKLSND